MSPIVMVGCITKKMVVISQLHIILIISVAHACYIISSKDLFFWPTYTHIVIELIFSWLSYGGNSTVDAMYIAGHSAMLFAFLSIQGFS